MYPTGSVAIYPGFPRTFPVCAFCLVLIINNVTFYFQKRSSLNNKHERKKSINLNTIKKINEPKSYSSEKKINKIDKILARLTRKKKREKKEREREKTKTTSTRNEREIVMTDPCRQ